ncbi:hypothetical protein SAMN04488117_101634 [Celeribacter baekdonensis]|uniref:Membrane transporter protein n=2 Tax=Celeribacter baekdonensis TaxID=875171 RepID=A0A1G7GMS8_9RHOB|nr:hypothetical protein SAMN04488117_101634 [Celeribacter baekdonensis]
MKETDAEAPNRSKPAAFIGGAAIGTLGGLIGLGGAEFRLPVLIGMFRFARYSRDQSFAVLGRNRAFLLVMAAGSIVGTFIGGHLLGVIPSGVLLPALAAILLISAVKVWRHA